MTSFPEFQLRSMLKKVDDYTQIPFTVNTNTTSVGQARQFLTEPVKDPLFFENDRIEEHKKLNSKYTSDAVINMKGASFTTVNNPEPI
jgi:hypothetical protein